MTKSNSIAAFVILGILLGAVLYNARKPNEPMYQGRGINNWLGKLNSAISRGDLQNRHEAEKAVQAIGAKAAPYIMTHLRRSNSSWRKNYRDLFPKLPTWVQRLIPSPREEFTFSTGSSALFAIGPSAKPALITALKDDDPVVRSASALTLGSLAHYNGTDIRDAVPALTECLRDADADVRCHSAISLGYLGPDAVAAVPGLIPLLEDPQVGRQKGSQVFVRAAAARTLGKIGSQAKSALPALRSVLNDTTPYNRSVAAIAIWRVDSEVTNTLPVLIEALNLVPEGAKWELVEGLKEMGAKAKEAFPALLGQILQATPNAPDRFTLEKITNALIKIDPEAAARAGVHPSAADGPGGGR
jgi:HEAT repeat protein